MRVKLISRIKVNGFEIGGTEDDRKVKIYAMLEDNSGFQVSLNTPWILLDGDIFYGCEKDLNINIDNGIDRAYAYLFEDEREHFEIPFDSELKK